MILNRIPRIFKRPVPAPRYRGQVRTSLGAARVVESTEASSNGLRDPKVMESLRKQFNLDR